MDLWLWFFRLFRPLLPLCFQKEKKPISAFIALFCEQFSFQVSHTTSTGVKDFLLGIPYHLWIYSSTTIFQFHAEPSFSGCAAWQGHQAASQAVDSAVCHTAPLPPPLPYCLTYSICPHPLRFACTAWQRCSALVTDSLAALQRARH